MKRLRRRLLRLSYVLGHELPWWFLHRFHPKYRFHVIRTGLPPGWVDRDHLMAVLIKKLLIDFVEKEKPFDHFDIENSTNRDDWDRLVKLYWQFKAINLDRIDYDELTAKLVEVVELRGLMWT